MSKKKFFATLGMKHVGIFPAMEAEQTSWVQGEDSPNRLDALVWGVTELMLTGSRKRGDFIVA